MPLPFSQTKLGNKVDQLPMLSSTPVKTGPTISCELGVHGIINSIIDFRLSGTVISYPGLKGSGV
jgi:hypothetical protein